VLTIQIYERTISNKPKIIEKTGNIFIFQCSEDKAKAYFPQFLEEVEIIEPTELRNWFKETFKKIYIQYT